MATFDSATPFLLLARIHVKTGCVDDYLELARETDAAFAAHVSNPPVQAYLQKHAELGDSFSIEVYGTVGDDCSTLMESFGLPLKIFETRLGYSRV